MAKLCGATQLGADRFSYPSMTERRRHARRECAEFSARRRRRELENARYSAHEISGGFGESSPTSSRNAAALAARSERCILHVERSG